ncbi:MAG TPA: ribbon-helix-helix domain-containing protein [Chloroflexota bacterium]
MPTAKVAVTIDRGLLGEVDRWVAAGEYPSRSSAVQAGLARLRGDRARRRRLLRELAKLDPHEERALADERLAAESPWPPY